MGAHNEEFSVEEEQVGLHPGHCLPRAAQPAYGRMLYESFG
jgi:hypothetical protein